LRYLIGENIEAIRILPILQVLVSEPGPGPRAEGPAETLTALVLWFQGCRRQWSIPTEASF